MGYKEEIFDRLEQTGISTIGEIKGWLAGPKKNPESYQNFAVQLQEPFAIREQAEKTKNIKKLESLKNDSIGTSVSETKTVKLIQNRINTIRTEKIQQNLSTTSQFRNELKTAQNAEELEGVLERALTDLGEGKNYDSLVAASEILKDRFS